MNTLCAIASAVKPNGLWEKILFALDGKVASYAVAIILITLAIKILMTPLDIFNKIIMKKNNRKMAVIQPELNKIEQRYKNNLNLKNQKINELYKRENYNIQGTCLGMVLNMGLTLLIFMSLFASLNNVANYKMREEFIAVQTAYESVYNETTIEGMSDEEKSALKVQAGQVALAKYEEVREGFLWVKSIWRPDTATSSVMKYSEFNKSILKKSGEVSEADYNDIMGAIEAKYNNWNGKLILPILSIIITYFSMQMNVFMAKIKAKREGRQYVAEAQGSAKAMTIVMPIIMGIFAIFYNTAFSVYIVIGAIWGLITTPFTTLLVDKVDAKRAMAEEQKYEAEYSRRKKIDKK